MLAIGGIVAVVLLVVACTVAINSYSRYILSAHSTMHQTVGIVLGAGVAPNGKPYRELQARLDVAAQPYTTDK